MQMAVIEAARSLLGLANATSSEFGKNKESIIGLLTEWVKDNIKEKRKEGGDLGGTMRLGSYNCKLKKGSKVYSDSINLITVESNISRELGKLQKKYRKYIDIGSYPFFRLGRVGVSIVLRSQNKHKIFLCKTEILKNIVKKKKIKKV